MVVLEEIIAEKADKEYFILKSEIKTWEDNYIEKNYASQSKLVKGNKKGLIFIDGDPSWDNMEKAKQRKFGKRLNRILKMHFFVEGFSELAEINV